jgi:predicted RNA binding protein YcfA (HicA-like mRNA interferase family)
MVIPYRRLRNVKPLEICRVLERDGARLLRQHGSHAQFIYSDGRRITVPISNKPLRIKTLQAIIQNANWTETDLYRLKLL